MHQTNNKPLKENEAKNKPAVPDVEEMIKKLKANSPYPNDEISPFVEDFLHSYGQAKS